MPDGSDRSRLSQLRITCRAWLGYFVPVAVARSANRIELDSI